MQRLVFSALILISLFLSSQYFTAPQVSPESISEKRQVEVRSVIDGDTIIIADKSGTKTVRLIGIDTPEVDPNRGGPECYGKEASEYLRQLLQDSLVTLESDPSQTDTDTYGRLLRFVFTSDGTNINKILIEKGYAKEFTYKIPYRYQSEFLSAQQIAQEQKLGLWGACTTYKR
jgi:micrococcal nuclease